MTSEFAKALKRPAINFENLSVEDLDLDARIHLTKAWVSFAEASAKSVDILELARTYLMVSFVAWGGGIPLGAALSVRAATENLIGWLFYKDHPIELKAAVRGEQDFLLPKAVEEYAKKYIPKFESRYIGLSKKMIRTERYFYSEISNLCHIDVSLFNNTDNVMDIMLPEAPDSEFGTFVGMVDEFISDFYASYFGDSFHSFPESIKYNISNRLCGHTGKFF